MPASTKQDKSLKANAKQQRTAPSQPSNGPNPACATAFNMLSYLLSVSRNKIKRIIGAARTLACVLAGVMLVFELLAANTEFHRALHKSGTASTDTCVLCQFANGQVDSPPPILTLASPVRLVTELAPRVDCSVRSNFDYLSSPSRAPPASSPSLSVVG